MGLLPQKIFIIGNIAGGKTLLARHLSHQYQIPCLHVDSIQFLPPMEIRPLDETRAIIHQTLTQEKWIIDGYGPLDILERRFQEADQIIFIDLPLFRHYWWLCKRQIKNLWSQRVELPSGCTEISLAHTIKLFKTLKGMHTQMRPELIKILNEPRLQDKLVWIRTLDQWNQLHALSVDLKEQSTM